MWEVDNKTPFATAGYFVRDKAGAEHWCVAVRGLFDVRPDGMVALAQDQEPVRLAPVYAGENAEELIAETDIMPFRPRADVLLSGKAIAPEGKEFGKHTVRFSCGAVAGEALALAPRRMRKT